MNNTVALSALVVSLRRWELKDRAPRSRSPHWQRSRIADTLGSLASYQHSGESYV